MHCVLKRTNVKNLLTSYIQTIVTGKLCKGRHIVGIIGKVVSLLCNTLCSLQDAVIVGSLKWAKIKSIKCEKHNQYLTCENVWISCHKKWHLEFFELLQNHVVRHVVKEAVGRSQDDVTKLHVKGRAVSCFRTGGKNGGMARSVTSETGACCVWAAVKFPVWSKAGQTSLCQILSVDAVWAFNLTADSKAACPCQTQRSLLAPLPKSWVYFLGPFNLISLLRLEGFYF